jgi:hypothetical protein
VTKGFAVASQSGSPRGIRGDTIVVICFVVLTTLYLYQSFFLERTLMSDFVGPSMFPQIVATTALILAGIYFFQLLTSRTPELSGEETGDGAGAQIANLLPVVPIVFYVLILEPLGFLFSTAIYVFGAMLLFGQTIVKSLVYAVTMSIAFFILFYYLLLTQVPMGWLVDTSRVLPFLVELRRMIEG